MGLRGPGSRHLVCRRLSDGRAVHLPVPVLVADRARGVGLVRRRPGLAALLLLAAVPPAALLHGADLHGGRAVVLLLAALLVAALLVAAVLLLVALLRPAAAGLLAGCDDCSELRLLQRVGAAARLDVGAHAGVEAAQVHVDQRILCPAVGVQLERVLHERAVVLSNAPVALVQVEQLGDTGLVAPPLRVVHGQRVEVLLVGMVLATVDLVPGGRVVGQQRGGELDALLVVHAGARPHLDRLDEARDVVDIALKESGGREFGRLGRVQLGLQLSDPCEQLLRAGLPAGRGNVLHFYIAT